MIGITAWASLDKNVLQGFAFVWQEPWGIATLADAYCGFLTFYAWVFYRERSAVARLTWFVIIMIFGNIAMSFYMLLILWRLDNNARAQDVLLRPAA